MKESCKALILVVFLAGAWGAGASTEAPPEESGFAEFVESDIIPLMVETGEVEAVSSEWPETPPPVRPEDASGETDPGAAPTPAEPDVPPAWRDPFWPVGYTPPPPREPVDTTSASTNKESASAFPQWDAALKTVAVQGILKTGADSYVAMVNGQVVGTKDVVSVRFGGREYRWQVAAVSERGVSFSRLEEDMPSAAPSAPAPSP